MLLSILFEFATSKKKKIVHKRYFITKISLIEAKKKNNTKIYRVMAMIAFPKMHKIYLKQVQLLRSKIAKSDKTQRNFNIPTKSRTVYLRH